MFKDEQGRVRSGWVVATFVVVALGTMGFLSVPLGLLQLLPNRETTLSDWRLFFNSSLLLWAGALATLICAIAFRTDPGFSLQGIGRRVALGAALGALTLALTCVLPVLVGQGTLTGPHAKVKAVVLAGLMQLAFIGPTGIGEELLTRGVALRELARGTHPALAVFLTGSVFGALHWGNANATWVSVFNVALVGWWFGALALKTGSIWAPIAMHVSWNFFEGFVFGAPVSGLKPGVALLHSSIGERGFWQGGAFGPEASGLTAVLLAIGLGVTVWWPRRTESKAEKSTSESAPIAV